MQHAPPVTYPLGRSRVAVLVTVFIWTAGLLAVSMWLAQPGLAPWRQHLSLGLLAVCGLAAVRSLANMAAGHIAWTGQHWLHASGGAEREGVLQVCLDLQNQLLVRFLPVRGRAVWIWLERARRPQRWAELRRAVHARSRPAAPGVDAGAAQTL